MKTSQARENHQAFTLFEALIVVAMLMLLAALTLPRFARRYRYAVRISCISNLKQISLAYRIWAGDNNDKYPMAVSTNQGGSMELFR